MRYLIIISLLIAASWQLGQACTSAIISGRATANGRPLLWKHRDTSQEDNKVERIAATDSTFEYVALFNASDRHCREAWVGYNSQGFAVMNTAVYNLKADTVTQMDREGLVMAQALRQCTTVADFERLLGNLPRPLGVEACFGAIDAQGNGAYFETCNYGYVKYDLADAPDGILVRSNYAHSGRPEDRKGEEREANAIAMLKPGNISAQQLTEVLSRQFYSQQENRDYTDSEKQVIADAAFIPRYSSVASVVIEGIMPGESQLLTTMWVALGFPPCAETWAVWLDEAGVPQQLRGTGPDGHSPQCDRVLQRKHDALSGKKIDLKKLYNSQGTGYAQQLIEHNAEVYRRGYETLEWKRRQMR